MVDGERIVSGLIGVACLVMLARLALGASARDRMDRWLRQTWTSWQSRAVRLYRRQATRKEAEKATQEVLQRLMRQQQVEREGNVLTPKAFKRPDASGQTSSRSTDD